MKTVVTILALMVLLPIRWVVCAYIWCLVAVIDVLDFALRKLDPHAPQRYMEQTPDSQLEVTLPVVQRTSSNVAR